MMIHFIRPQWLWLLIPACLYGVWAMYTARQRNPWRAICDAHLLPILLQESQYQSKRLLHISLIIFLLVAIFALSGPAWQKEKLPVFRDLGSMMLVLDLSSTMQASDLKPDRITRAKFKIRDLINANQNNQIGLVVFSGEAFVAAPLSQDGNTLIAMLDELSPQMMPVSGADSGPGLTEALRLLTQSGVHHANVILITASDPTANSWIAAKAIKEAGHQLNVFATMEKDAAKQNTVNTLQALANMGGGSLYLFTSDDTDIRYIGQKHGTQTVKDEDVDNLNLWQDAGPWFCLLLLPLVLVIIREKVL